MSKSTKNALTRSGDYSDDWYFSHNMTQFQQTHIFWFQGLYFETGNRNTCIFWRFDKEINVQRPLLLEIGCAKYGGFVRIMRRSC